MIYYTSIEQSDHLLDLGLLPASADMEYFLTKETYSMMSSVPFVKDETEVENSALRALCYRIPCWSLAALLELMPESYQLTKGKNNKYQFMLFHNLIHDWFNTPLEAVYNMVCYLLENGLIKNCKS